MKLYLIHCGFYDEKSGFGVYEFHTNFFVVATDPTQARAQVKEKPEFKAQRMHVDGLIEVNAVGGYSINPTPAASCTDDIRVIKHRDLASKPAPPLA